MSDCKAECTQNSPFAEDLEPGTYWWCSCGKSKKGAFCDGAHKEEKKFKPVKVEITADQKVFLCGCKKTKAAPYCDGSHKE